MAHTENPRTAKGQRPPGRRGAGWALWVPTGVLMLLCGFTCVSNPNAAWALAAMRHAQALGAKMLPHQDQAPAARRAVAWVPRPAAPRFASSQPLLGSRIVLQRPITAPVVTPPAPAVTSTVRYAPRPGFEARMVGGQFQGSEDGQGWTTLYTVGSAPPVGQWTSVTLPLDLTQYRFLRYLSPDGAYGNIAELEFDSNGVKLTGTPFGTPGSWSDHGNDFSKTFDGDLGSFFDAPAPGNGDFVGIDRGAGTGGTVPVTSTIRYAPRPGFEGRMVGGQFQGSTDGTTYVTLYTVGSAPPAGQWTSATLAVDLTQYRYLRYLSPDGAYGNIAELEFDSNGVKLTGTPFGTPGSWSDHGNDFSKTFDGDLGSFFDAPAPGNGDFVGIDRGTGVTATAATATPIGPVLVSAAAPETAPVPVAQAAPGGGTATQTLMPIAVPAPPAPVVLPIEVMGADGTTASVQVSVPASASVTGLWLEAHNLSYPDKASVQINGGPWTPLDNSTVQVADPGKSYGGIGGAFSTLKMTLPLSPQSVHAGTNTVSFRFNMTDGVSSGFRVLAFNFLDANGNTVLPSSAFTEDDPNTWQAPLPDAQDIAAGQALWHSGQLLQSDIVLSPIHATCSDCHTDDGRDLKYFNYSNYSIIKRAEFHGLSATQGEQIASYIRTLNVPNPGRPWNPPYQPGPGLDSQPVQDWAAGAGVDAVLPNSQAMLPYVFPSTGGVPNASDIAANKDLNTRELPIPILLPDWNHWLPPVWPGDIPGSGFTTSLAFTRYPAALNTAAQAQANPTQANFQALGAYLYAWLYEGVQFLGISHAANPSESGGPGSGIGTGSVPLTPATATQVYSVGLWGRVKEWGMMQKYGLEGMGQIAYGPTTKNGLPIENRVWFSGGTFQTSPSFLGIYGNDVGQYAAGQYAALPTPITGINQNPLSLSPLVAGTPQLYQELRVDWYWLQFILNDGDYNRSGNNPIDWGYFPGTVAGLGATDGTDTSIMHFAARVKMMQQYNNGVAPDAPGVNPDAEGWDIRETQLGYLIDLGGPMWGNTPSATVTSTRTALASSYLTAWLPTAEQYTPQQYWTQGRVSHSETTSQAAAGYIDSPDAAQAMYASVPILDGMGVDPTLVNNYVGWLQGLLPNVNWAHDR